MKSQASILFLPPAQHTHTHNTSISRLFEFKCIKHMFQTQSLRKKQLFSNYSTIVHIQKEKESEGTIHLIPSLPMLTSSLNKILLEGRA